MATAISYIRKNKDIALTSENFTEVDSLVLCELFYSNMDIYMDRLPMYLRDIDKDDLKKLTHKSFHEIFSRDIVRNVYKSDRYKNIDLIDIEKSDDIVESEQFFAATLRLTDSSLVIIFRGTDTSIHGWEESLSLSFDPEIPSQSNAKKYINRVSKNFTGNIIVCGHSKGGNLAVFASSTCDKEISDKILNVYNLDGPGFFNEFFERDDYIDIEDKIKKYIPKHSIFGLLMYSNAKTTVIESNALLLNQHLLSNWQIEDNHFKYIKTTDNLSKSTIRSITTWLETKDLEERKDIVKTLIDLIEDSGIEDAKSASDNIIGTLLKIKNNYDKNSEDYKNLEIAFNEFFTLYKDEIVSLLPQIKLFRKDKN